MRALITIRWETEPGLFHILRRVFAIVDAQTSFFIELFFFLIRRKAQIFVFILCLVIFFFFSF